MGGRHVAQALNSTAGTLLGFLLEAPMTGWALDVAIESSVGEFWNVTRSQVYRELRQLATDGLVTAGESGPRERVPHEITPDGRRAFLDWVGRDLPAESRRIPVLLTTFFGEHLAPDRLAEVLAAHRAANRIVLGRYQALEAALRGEPYALATVRFGIAYCRMVERWIDETTDLLPPDDTENPPGG